ncbi:MAG: FAD-dependent oxidoreductase, partial [Gammaproteobacteria bacterium]|nr:FAD-dependent oxidoreductase [Gammaproteobacteria bacterium]
FTDKQRPGSPCLDAPVTIGGRDRWLLNQLGGRFTGVYFAGIDEETDRQLAAIGSGAIPVHLIIVKPAGARAQDCIIDKKGLVHRHYDAAPGSFYLIRPDQHVAARWRKFSKEKAYAALGRSTGIPVDARG